MANLIQPITVQEAYNGITHARRWAWNWWWRKVDDDDGDGFPSLEPRTDSRSALPREFRAWRRLRIVKHNESFSLIFFPEHEYIELELRSVELQGTHEAGGRAQGVGAPPTLVDRVWAPGVDSFASIFINSKNILREVSGHSENFYFCTKITPWQFCWKQRQSGLVPFKSYKLESKTWAKVFGKVDTTETYQPPPQAKTLACPQAIQLTNWKKKKKNFYKLYLLLLL